MSTSNPTQFTILYIEDDPTTRKLTSHLLQKECTDLIVAENGLDGFMKFKKTSIDLIITDLSMPKISGIDFIKMIRDINHDVPIMIISIYTNNEMLQNSINYGIKAYIQKPIDEKTLTSKIKTIKKDIREQKITHEYKNIINTSAIIYNINNEGIISYVNENFCKISGYMKEELLGQSHHILNPQKERINFISALLNQIKISKKAWSGVKKQQTKQGELYYLQTTIQPIMDTNNEVEEFILLSLSITDVIHPEEQLNDYLMQHKEPIIFLIKIDEFKYLEHSFTKKITKKLQKLFAQELLKHMPKECGFSNIYLLNNGEFAFVKKYHALIETEYLIQNLQNFQEKINREKIKIGIVNYTLSIICSLAYGTDALSNAKIGLTKILTSKEEFIFATNLLEKITKDSNEKLHKFIMLKEAIDSYKIISYFQPIVDNKTRKTIKYESLVRLIDEHNNILSPYHFLEIAKEGKYYHTITQIVLRNSFRALFNSDIEISINLSALDIEDERIRSEFFTLLERYKTETERITIEILEDEKIKNQNMTKTFIEETRKYGVKIALDDFGKGFSNFARIQSYQPDYIKIDGSLIRNIEEDQFSKDLVQTIVFFAQKQNIKTIAEYVENENIYTILKNLGVDYSQGHYFSKAGDLKEFISS